MNGDKPSKLKPALIAGAALGVVSPIVGCLNLCCCAPAIGAGLLATFLYFKNQPKAAEPPYGDGAVVGLLAGMIGGLVQPVVALPLNLLAAKISNPEQMTQVMDQMRQAIEESDLPERLMQLLMWLVDFMEQSAGGFDPARFLKEMAFWLVGYAIFATLGGVFGVTFFGKAKS